MRGGAIWAITVMVVAGTAGVVGLAAVGDSEAAVLLPLLIGFLAPTIASLVAASKAGENATALTKIGNSLNGELDARIETAVRLALEKYQCAKLPPPAE